MMFALLAVVFFAENLSAVEQKIIPIFMATDDGYSRPTTVALVSLLENGAVNTFYDVKVLIPGELKPESKKIIGSLQQAYNNCKIDFVDMGEKYNNSPRWKSMPSTYYRLDIPSLFPKLKKCIFLDGDVIVRHDLSEMYDMEVNNYYISSVISRYRPSKKVVNMKVKKLEMPDFSQYVNTGVMIMNLESIRENKIEEKISKFVEEKRQYLGKFPFLAEQDALNAVCYGRILTLPDKYGFLINHVLNNHEDVEEDPTIVHFAHRPKPWKNAKKSVFHEEWWNYAKKTSFYDDEMKKLNKKKNKKKMKKNVENGQEKDDL